MKILVEHRDGTREVITMIPPLSVKMGDNMNQISCGDGTDHYFFSDGTYDGWGRAISEGKTMEDAEEIIDRFEEEREYQA